MNALSKLRGIIALLFLVIVCQVLIHVPPLHDFVLVLWGLSFAFLLAALVLAVQRHRGTSHERRTLP